MRGIGWLQLTRALGLGLSSFAVLRAASGPLITRIDFFALSIDRPAVQMAAPPPRAIFDRVIREAQRWHLRSWQAVNQERDAVEAWDSEATDSIDQAAWRKQLMARDRGGYLRRARVAGGHAAALARGTEERYRAALLLAVLACEAGDHQTELQEAHALARLDPHRPMTQLWLRHAAECSRVALQNWINETQPRTIGQPGR